MTSGASTGPRDALVVGGGPAGATAAHRLARAGLRVTLLEAECFPRVKPCAGWVTAQVWRTLELDPASYPHTLQPFRAATVRLDGESRPRVTRWPRTASWGIVRREFDAHLLERARAAGVEVVEGRRVAEVAREGDGMRLETEDGTSWFAPVVLGAGGHGCPVARALGEIPANEVVVIARESETRIDAAHLADATAENGAPDLIFAPDLSGYAWVFVKGDHLNVGVGCVGDGRELNRRLAVLLEDLRAGTRLPSGIPWEPFRGHAYAVHTAPTRRASGAGFLLVGDSAGLARALSGEGIGPAVESGVMAADAVIASGGDSLLAARAYRQALRARFGSGRHPLRDRVLRALPRSAPERAARLALRSPWARRRLVLEGAFGMGR